MGGQLQIQNFKVWQSTDTPSSGCTLKFGTTETYRTPVGGLGNPSPVQTNNIPTSEPQSPNLSIGGVFNPEEGQQLSQVNQMTDFGVLQLEVSPTQTSGGTQVINISYDEIT